jgi:MFS family permease
MSTNEKTSTVDGQVGDRRSVLAALVFTFVTNIDMTAVLTLLPVAVFGGTSVSPLEFSLALSIQVVASLVGGIVVPIMFRGVSSGWLLSLSSLMKSFGFAALLATVHAPGLFSFAVLAGFGRGVSKVAVRVLLTDATTEKARGKAFQLFFVIMNVALLLAPLVAEAADRLGVARLALVLLIAVELAGGVWAGITARRLVSDTGKAKKLSISGGVGLLVRGGPATVLGYTLVAYFAMGFIMAIFLLYNEVNPTLSGYRELFLSFEPLALIVIQLAMMPVLAKVGRAALYAAAAVTCGVGVALSFTSSLVLVLAGLALFAFAESLAMPQSQVDAAKVAPKEQLAAMLSLVTVTSAVGEIVGNVLAGWIVRNAGGSLPSVAVSGMAVAVVVLVGFAGAGYGIVRQTAVRETT